MSRVENLISFFFFSASVTKNLPDRRLWFLSNPAQKWCFRKALVKKNLDNFGMICYFSFAHTSKKVYTNPRFFDWNIFYFIQKLLLFVHDQYSVHSVDKLGQCILACVWCSDGVTWHAHGNVSTHHPSSYELLWHHPLRSYCQPLWQRYRHCWQHTSREPQLCYELFHSGILLEFVVFYYWF